jgi:hypothetical protein
VLPSLGAAARPRDLFRSPIPTILDLTVTASHGTWHTVGVVNWDAESGRREVRLSELADCPEGGRYHVYEFWTKYYNGRLRAEDTIDLGELPPHGSALLLVKRVEPLPQLVTTEAHLSQGAVEIDRWEVEDEVLTIRASRTRGTVRILAYFPDQWNPENVEVGPDRLARLDLQSGETVRIALRRDGHTVGSRATDHQEDEESG